MLAISQKYAANFIQNVTIRINASFDAFAYKFDFFWGLGLDQRPAKSSYKYSVFFILTCGTLKRTTQL